MFRTKKFKMKDLPLAKDLIKELKEADDKRNKTWAELTEIGLTDKMIRFLREKPGVEIVEFESNKIVYNTTEQVSPRCDWWGYEVVQKMKALSDGRLQIEETFNV